MTSTASVAELSASQYIQSIEEEEKGMGEFDDAEEEEAVMFAALVAKGEKASKKRLDLRNAVKRVPSIKEWFSVLEI
jgi:hypothetical protein